MPESDTSKTTTNPVSKPLSGRTAIVTGASRGIGLAIAENLANAGAKLAICARNKHRLSQAQEKISSAGTEVFSMTCDVRDENGVAAFVRQTSGRFGQIDILINNAGIYKTQTVRGHRLEVWNEVLETNLTGSMLMCREVVSGMIDRRWGRIINISSVSGKLGELAGSAYSASKFGMIGFTQSLALEVAQYGVTANAVCPGWVLTDMAREQFSDEKWCAETSIEPCDSREIARLSIPQMEFTRAEDVAALVTYLCGESARGITGQAINICGGLSLH